MKTKVTVIGASEEFQKVKKPIEFIKLLTYDGLNTEFNKLPKSYQNIELISLNYARGLDVLFAYNEDRSDGFIYLGHFNDGIV